MKNFTLIVILMNFDFLNININSDRIRDDSLFDSKQYWSIIESLQFLFIYTQSDIVFSVNYLIRKNFTLKLQHWKTVKHTLCYLWDVMNLSIEFTSSDDLHLVAFSDINWAGDLPQYTQTLSFDRFFFWMMT